jgi:hypothetical protein
MSDQLAGWLWDIATVLSPIAAIVLLVRHILRDLLGSIIVLRKIGRVLRSAFSRRRQRPRVSRGKK